MNIDGYTFKRCGVMHPTVTVREGATGTQVAIARARVCGSYDLEIDGRLTATFKCLSVWRAQFGWVTADGALLGDEHETPMMIALGKALKRYTANDAAITVTTVLVATSFV